MTTEKDLIILQNAAEKLEEYLGGEFGALPGSRETLQQRLTELVVHLLLHEMERLLQLLYRVDVNEKEVKAAFGQHDPERIAPRLAELIIDRELKKAETRIRYRKNQDDIN